jgi:glycosyltransferase involved in cell wall biosynthesis
MTSKDSSGAGLASGCYGSSISLRVALDVTPLLGKVTGVGAFVAGICAALPDPDTEISGYALTARGRAGLADVVPDQMRVVARPLPAKVVRALWMHLDWPTAATVAGRCDVVHGTNFVVPPSRRASAVVSVHDLTFVHFPELSRPDTLQYRTLLRRAAARGAFVHTPSGFVAAEVAEWLGIPGERVTSLPYGVPDRAGLLAATPERGRLLAGADRYIVALGTEDPRKGLPTLIEAFDEVAAREPEVSLVIAGPRGAASPDIDRAIAGSHHRDRIKRLGYVDQVDRNDLLSGASVLAYPSRYEGFGFPPLEALSVGVPVVASATGSLPEVLGSTARLVPPGDVDALAAGLLAELAEPPTEQLLALRRDWAGRYTWEALAAGLRHLYRAIAA